MTNDARYSRQVRLPEVGEAGQERLRNASVLIVGAGGLGSPAAMYLAAAGVGRLGIVDYDEVDLSNLHRQILYTTADVGVPKLDAARERLSAMNPDVVIETHPCALTSGNALEIVAAYDVVVDGTDNFPTRYLINDACVLTGRPNVYGSVFRFEGQVSVFFAGHGPCYRCLYPEPPPAHLVPSCAEGGVLGVLPGVIGTMQAMEAIKLITGAGEPLIGRLILFDALSAAFRQVKLQRNPACRICGDDPSIRELIDYEEFCNPVQDEDITPAQLSERLNAGETPLLVDVREIDEWNSGHLRGAQLISLRELPQKLDTLPRDREIVLYCRSGGRSALAKQLLKSAGFKSVRNMLGGMIRWATEGDPSRVTQ